MCSKMGTLHPLEVFPLEIWKTIFEKLGSQQGCSTNLFNCSRVCTTFENVLKETQSQWIFESIYPLIFPYQKGDEVLACRKVCKEWCRVVETFLEDFEGRRPFNIDTTRITSSFLGEYDTLQKKGLQYTMLDRIEDLSKFMKNRKNVKNPFIGGSLWLSEMDSCDTESANGLDRENLFWKKVSEFLPMFGKHVKYIELSSFKSDSVNAKAFYEFLRQYLLSLPNLRSLAVLGAFHYFEQGSTNSEENCTRLMQLNEFLKMDASSLPEIASLESIELSTFRLPASICEKLIGGINPRNLKRLKLRVTQLSVETMITFPESLPSLTELHLDNIESFEQFHHLTNLVGAEAPLGKLLVSFYPDSMISFRRVCETINRFGPTLRILSITGLGHELSFVSLNILKTPHVRSLKLDGVAVAFGPGFLPSSLTQSLEYFHILFSREQPRWRTEFKKWARIEKLACLPVWSEMSKLKVIKVHLQNCEDKTITCTREMHESAAPCVPLYT